jgi:arabinogalactan oligomer/maltooligosaccharide transport system substrate-binding protein
VGWITLFASKGYLLNIDSYVSQRDLSDYKNAPLNAALAYDEYNGHLYGLPQVTDFLALLYNNNELKGAGITHPPTTMTELRTDAKRIVQQKRATYGFETSGTSYYALPFLYAFGGGMFDQHNNIVVDSNKSVEGLQFLVSLENTDHVMPPKVDPSSGLDNMTKDFMNGTTAMIFDGPFAVSHILTGTSFRRDNGNLGIAAIPTGPSGQTGSPLGGQSYVISAGTPHPWEAYSFIKYMSSQPVQIAIAKKNHTLPTRQSAYQDSGVSSDLFISAFLKVKKTAVARPAIPQGRYLFDIFDPSIWAAIIGVQSPNDALSTVADDWRQLGAGKQGP